MEFHLTGMGRRFFESTMPQIAEALEGIAKGLLNRHVTQLEAMERIGNTESMKKLAASFEGIAASMARTEARSQQRDEENEHDYNAMLDEAIRRIGAIVQVRFEGAVNDDAVRETNAWHEEIVRRISVALGHADLTTPMADAREQVTRILNVRRGMERAADLMRAFDNQAVPSVHLIAQREIQNVVADFVEAHAKTYGNGR